MNSPWLTLKANLILIFNPEQQLMLWVITPGEFYMFQFRSGKKWNEKSCMILICFKIQV